MDGGKIQNRSRHEHMEGVEDRVIHNIHVQVNRVK